LIVVDAPAASPSGAVTPYSQREGRSSRRSGGPYTERLPSSARRKVRWAGRPLPDRRSG